MNKNQKLLADFILYCVEHPHERFWQALRNWSGFNFVWVSSTHETHTLQDSFYFEGKHE